MGSSLEFQRKAIADTLERLVDLHAKAQGLLTPELIQATRDRDALIRSSIAMGMTPDRIAEALGTSRGWVADIARYDADGGELGYVHFDGPVKL